MTTGLSTSGTIMPIPLRNHFQFAHRPLTAFLLVAVLMIVFATACIAEDDLTLDQRHRHLSEQLMCPVCDGQTIDQSSAAISIDMKSVIWQQLEAGQSNAEIREYFVERYGEAVLAAPTNTGVNLTAWVLPAVIAAVGLAAVGAAYLRMRIPRMTAGSSSATAAADPEASDSQNDELEPYLERVDAEFGSATGKTPS